MVIIFLIKRFCIVYFIAHEKDESLYVYSIEIAYDEHSNRSSFLSVSFMLAFPLITFFILQDLPDNFVGDKHE